MAVPPSAAPLASRLDPGRPQVAGRARTLHADLVEYPPQEFQQVPSLIAILSKAPTLVTGLCEDSDAGAINEVLNMQAFETFLGEVDAAVRDAKATLKAGHIASWRTWVQEAGRKRQGWAQKWTAVHEAWTPPRAKDDGTFSGRPLETLKRERARLMSIWGSGPRPHQPFEAPQEAYNLVAPITPATLARAARSFPTRTAQTFDGFQPKHYALLDDYQQQVTLSLLVLVERVGAMPRAIAAILTKLIPKVRATEHVFRGIGLQPSLYRLWARCRQVEARGWEKANPEPMMGHQAGRSTMEIVYLQALRAEAGQAERGHSAFML